MVKRAPGRTSGRVMNSSSAIVKRKLEKSYEVRVKGDGTIFHVGYFRRREDAVLSLKKYEDRLRREKQQCTESSLLKYSQIKTTRDGRPFRYGYHPRPPIWSTRALEERWDSVNVKLPPRITSLPLSRERNSTRKRRTPLPLSLTQKRPILKLNILTDDYRRAK